MSEWLEPGEARQQWQSVTQDSQPQEGATQEAEQWQARGDWAEPDEVRSQWQQLGAADSLPEDERGWRDNVSDFFVGVGEGVGQLGATALAGVEALYDASYEHLPTSSPLNIGRAAFERVRGEDIPPIQDRPVYKAAEWLRDVSFDEERGESVARTSGQVAGSVFGFGAATLATGGAGAPAVLGVLSGSGDFYWDAKESGADEEDAVNAGLVGGMAGLGNVLPATALLKGLERSGGKPAQRFLIGLSTNALTNAGQEAAYAWMRNWTARDFIGYDPDRSLTENLAQSTVAGGGAGAFMYSLARLMGVRAPAAVRSSDIRQAEQELRAERGLSEDDPLPQLALPPPPWSGEFVVDPDGATRQLTESEAEAQAQYRQSRRADEVTAELENEVGLSQARLVDEVRAREQASRDAEFDAAAAQAREQGDIPSREQTYREAFDALEQQDQQRLQREMSRMQQELQLQPETSFSQYIDSLRAQDLSRLLEETGQQVEQANAQARGAVEDGWARTAIEAAREGQPRNPIMAEALRAATSRRAERQKDEVGSVDEETTRRLHEDREVEFSESSRQQQRNIDHVREVHSTPLQSRLTEAENAQYAELDWKAQYESLDMTSRDWARYEFLQAKAAGETQTSGRRQLTTEEKDQLVNELEQGRRADRGDDGVRFAAGDDSAPRGMSVARLQEAVERMLRQWPQGPAARVIRRQRDLPARLRQKAERQEGVVRAVYDRDSRTVYLIARNIDNEQQAGRLLLHESVAHHGVRQSLGNQADTHLLALYRRHRAEAEQIAAQYRINTAGVDGKILAAEELLARRAERLSPRSAVQAIRDMLRRLAEAMGVRLRDSDIADLLRQGRRFIEGRRVRVPQPGVTRAPEQGLGEDAAWRSFTEENTRRINARLQESLRDLRPRDQQIDIGELQAANDSFNTLMQHSFNLLQVTKRNPHVEGLQTYTEFTRQWNNARMQWIQRANDTIVEWEKLGPERAQRVGDLLFDQTLEGRFFSESEIGQYGLDAEQMAVYSRVRGDLNDFLTQMEEAHLNDVRRGLSQRADETESQFQERVREAEQSARRDFSAMRNTPYFPLPRFGRWAVRGTATETVTYQGQTYQPGELVWFRTYDHKWQRFQRKERDIPPELKGKMRVGEEVVNDVAQDLLSFPPQLRQIVEGKLQEAGHLTSEQRRQLQDLSNQFAPTASFRNRMRRRKGVPGFNEDAMRGYASYFSSGANHIARTMFQNPMSEAIDQTSREARAIAREGGNADRRDRLAQYMRDHMDYNLNPQNEWSGLRSFGFNWYLGFMPRSAMVNLTQVPLITYPYLAARHGDAQAVKSISRAYKDVTQYLTTKGDALSQEEAAAMERAGAEGFIDESMAQVLAAVAEGRNLNQAMSSTKVGRRVRQFSYASSYLFTKAEQLNRRVTLVSAYRLARDKGASHEGAYREARAAVENTQYEYSRWNRPGFMRGKKSVLFLFYQYIQNTAVFMFGGDRGATRAWMMYLIAGGALGLPFVENILDLVDNAASRMFNKKVDTRLSARQLMLKWGDEIREELGQDWLAAPFDNPDLVLRGASRYAFGHLDFSGSISMGRPIPGTSLFQPRGELTSYQIWQAQQDVLGAVASIPMGVWQALSSDNPDTWKRAEMAMPSILTSASMATRRAYRGEETNWQGARLIEYDYTDPLSQIELFGRAIGAEPTRLRQIRERDRLQREHTRYWADRRSLVLTQYDYARRTGQDMSDMRKAVRRFNKDVPFPEMRLGAESIRQSLQARERRRREQERDISQQRQNFRLHRDISSAFPEIERGRGE